MTSLIGRKKVGCSVHVPSVLCFFFNSTSSGGCALFWQLSSWVLERDLRHFLLQSVLGQPGSILMCAVIPHIYFRLHVRTGVDDLAIPPLSHRAASTTWPARSTSDLDLNLRPMERLWTLRQHHSVRLRNRKSRRDGLGTRLSRRSTSIRLHFMRRHQSLPYHPMSHRKHGGDDL